MQDVFAAARSSVSRSFIEARFGVAGSHWEGRDFKTLNPTRPDGGIGSFSIREDGKWYDFATGDHGDVFDLLSTMEGRPAVDIAREMSGGSSAPAVSPPPPRTTPKADWVPIPEGKIPSFSSAPSYLTLYRDRKGRGMFYVVRRDMPPPAKKEIFPIYFTGSRWEKGLPPSLDYRPLLEVDDGKTILLVEGEKCATVAQAHLPGYSVTTWHGGAPAARKADLAPLEGRDVVMWPDNDDPGKEAMDGIAARLRGKADLRIVRPPNGVPKGWDIADAIEEGRGVELLIEAAERIGEEEAADDGDQDDDVFMARNFTDLGNAERFIDRFGKSIRWNVDKGRWLVWDTNRWDDSDQSVITPMVKRTIAAIREENTTEAVAYAMKCESASRIRNMLELAGREPGIPIAEASLDPDPMILNTPGGIVDLENGTMIPADRSFMCSKVTRLIPAKGDCPAFTRFLDEIMLGRKDYIEFLQRWFGYCLTADMSAQTFAIFYGNGANGKSTLVELMARIMGTYAKTAPPDTFISKPQGNGIPNDIAALRGARLVLATETESNARLAESRVKSMTGGDVVSARFMRGEFFEFTPTWKIIISTNHRPRISGADYGIWRRIVLVPFEFVAAGEKLDPDLPRKLWAEAPAIMAWMVEGAAKWVAAGKGRKGLGISPDLMQETQEYREDEDVVGKFVSDVCVTRSEFGSLKVKAGDLYKCFVSWATDEGEKFAAQMTQSSFGRAMRERGYESMKGSAGVREYRGIGIKWKEGETNAG